MFYSIDYGLQRLIVREPKHPISLTIKKRKNLPVALTVNRTMYSNFLVDYTSEGLQRLRK